MSERRYGEWAGNPRGHAEHVTDCVESVYPDAPASADTAKTACTANSTQNNILILPLPPPEEKQNDRHKTQTQRR